MVTFPRGSPGQWRWRRGSVFAFGSCGPGFDFKCQEQFSVSPCESSFFVLILSILYNLLSRPINSSFHLLLCSSVCKLHKGITWSFSISAISHSHCWNQTSMENCCSAFTVYKMEKTVGSHPNTDWSLYLRDVHARQQSEQKKVVFVGPMALWYWEAHNSDDNLRPASVDRMLILDI